MAGGEDWEVQAPHFEEELMSRLAYRDDLGDAIGIIVSPPPHSVLNNGALIWGEWYLGSGMVVSNQVWDELSCLIQSSVEEAGQRFKSLAPLNRTVPIHPYDHPPAAQSIPEISAMLWEQGVPILAQMHQTVEAGLLLRWIYDKIRNWFDDKNVEIEEQNKPFIEKGKTAPHSLIEPRITLPRGAIVALVVAEIVDRVGYQPDLKIDVQAISASEYDSSGHPNTRTKYLAAVSYDGRRFEYSISASGKVEEYLLMEGHDRIVLPVPDLLNPEIMLATEPGDDHLEPNRRPDESGNVDNQ